MQQSGWWKRNNRTTNPRPAPKTKAPAKRNRTFKSGSSSETGHSTDTSNDTTRSGKSATAQTDSSIRPGVPRSSDGSGKSLTTSMQPIPKRVAPVSNGDVNILQAEPSSLTERQIRSLQQELQKTLNLKHQLEMELNLRAAQVEDMEDNLRLVAEQSKMIGVRAMEQEQKLLWL